MLYHVIRGNVSGVRAELVGCQAEKCLLLPGDDISPNKLTMPPVAIECVRNIRREERKFKRPFPPTPSPPACRLARRARAGWHATEQRESSQTAGQRRPDGDLGTEGRRVWRGGAGGDKLIGLPIDLEELHSVSREELQSYVQRLDSGLVDEDQEPPDELNHLTEDDLPSEIPSSDVALRELEEFLRQNQQDPGPNSGSDDPSDSA